MFERFKIVPQLWRTGRLTLRLARDSRVPLVTKLLLVATVVYIISPLDIVPDWFPVVGQADDLMVLLAGLNLFLKSCPRWLVEEHEDSLDGRRVDGARSRWDASEPYGPADRPGASNRSGAGEPIDARYQRVR